VFLLSALTLLSVACDKTTLISLIELGISTGEAIAVSMGVLPPDIAMYISQAETAFGDLSAELAAPDSTGEKIAAIHAELASIVLPDLSGLPAAAQQKIQTIDGVITQVLAMLPTSAAIANTRAMHSAALSKALAFNDSQRSRLLGLKDRADAVKQLVSARVALQP
jgi:hypothetical protein